MPRKKTRYITAEDALTQPRFQFIADWLVTTTAHKENRGPLGQYVRRRGKTYEIMSGNLRPIVVYATREPDRLFDYARRTQLGSEIRRAEDFRTEAYLQRDTRQADEREARARARRDLDAEIEAYLAQGREIRSRMPILSRHNTPEEIAERRRLDDELKRVEREVSRRRPPPPAYPPGAGIWRVLDD